MNPFSSTHAGLFVVVTQKGTTANLSINIGAGIMQKIAQVPSKALDASYWETCIGYVPHQVHSVESNASLTLDIDGNAMAIGKYAVGNLFDGKSASDLAEKVAGYVANFPSLDHFNCLVVVEKSDQAISLRSSYIATVPASPNCQEVKLTGNASNSTIDITSKEVLDEMISVFKDFTPPKNAEYFIIESIN